MGGKGIKDGFGLFGGAPKVTGTGLKMSAQAQQAESQVIQNQLAIANGEAPSTAAMQYQMAQNQALNATQAQAASARGVNPALAFRAANQNFNTATADAGMQSALLAEQEKRQAMEQLAAIAAGQRGVALQTSKANADIASQQRGQTLGILGGLGNAALTGKK